MRIKRPFLLIASLACCFALLAQGCQEESIRRYQAPRSQAGRQAPVTYEVPRGWRELFDPGNMRVAALHVEEGGQRAEVTITRLPGPAGGVLDNVNRWRGQINLGPVTDDQLKPDLRDVVVAGTPSKFVELLGSAKQGETPQRILGLVIPRGAQTWFIKMMGPDDLVARQKATFETFVGSVTINDAK